MTFSKTHRKCVGILATLATCFAIVAPTASALPPVGHPNALAVETAADDGVVVRFDGLPVGTVGATSGLQSRPAPADNIAVQTPQLPTIGQLEQFRFVPGAVPVAQAYEDAYDTIQRYVPGGLPAQVEAGNWRAVYGVQADVPEFSTDGPRTAPDTLVRPTEQLPVAEPGFDWTDAGVGIAIGAIVGLMLGAALLMGRRRGTLAGA
jgi:hypothetical protein